MSISGTSNILNNIMPSMSNITEERNESLVDVHLNCLRNKDKFHSVLASAIDDVVSPILTAARGDWQSSSQVSKDTSYQILSPREQKHPVCTPSSMRQMDCVQPIIYDSSIVSLALASLESSPSDICLSRKWEELKLLPLLATEDPFLLDDGILSADLRHHSLYFGTGLCTTKEMSAGLPFDVLGLIATAERVRITLGFGKIIQLIADTHAKSNKFESDDQVDARAAEFKRQISTVIHRLGLDQNYQVILASEFDTLAEYTEIYEGIDPGIAHEYVRREWSDMEYLAKTQNTCLKLSWKMPVKAGKIHKSDEAFFDKGFVTHFQRPYSFISNRASITFDPARLNVCPYTSATGEKRILIKPDEDAVAKLDEFSKAPHKAVGRAIESLATTVAFIDRTFDLQLPGDTLGAKTNAAIQKLFY